MSATTPDPRRRASDLREEALEQRLINIFREEVSRSRHQLRGEVTVSTNEIRDELIQLRKTVELGNLADVTDRARHGELIEGLRRDVDYLHERSLGSAQTALEPRIRTLEADNIASHKVGEIKRWLAGTVIALTGVILGCAAFLAQHTH